MSDESFDIDIIEQEESHSQTVLLPSNIQMFGEIEPDDVKIYIKQDVYKALEKYALADTDHERGTIILGNYYEELGKTHVVISNYIEARYTDASASTLTFTHETWDYIHKEHDARFPDKKIVGWQHTHPSYGIFLSNYDLFIHENFFNLPFQVAYVIDPIQNLRGFFQWKNGKIEKLKGFYVYDDVGKPIKIEQKSKEVKCESQAKPQSSRFNVLLLVLILLITAGSLFVWLQLSNTIKNQDEEIKRLQSDITLIDNNGDSQEESISTSELFELYNSQQDKIGEQQKEIDGLKSTIQSMDNQEQYIFYTVKSGDSLNGICAQLGIDYNKYRSRILELNHITNENIIDVGQELMFLSDMQTD